MWRDLRTKNTSSSEKIKLINIPARDHVEEALVGVRDLVGATDRSELGRTRIVARF